MSQLQLSFHGLPEHSASEKGGGEGLVIYCRGAAARCRQRRQLLKAAAKQTRQGATVTGADDPSSAALVLAQHAGGIAQDLGRLVLGLHAIHVDVDAGDPFKLVRTASQDALDEVFSRLSDERWFRMVAGIPGDPLPTDVAEDLAGPLLRAGEAATAEWFPRWSDAAELWGLVGHARKAFSHGMPGVASSAFDGPRGAGSLHKLAGRTGPQRGAFLFVRSKRTERETLVHWDTSADRLLLGASQLTEIEELAMRTLKFNVFLANQHLTRLERQCRFSLPAASLASLTAPDRAALRRHAV